MDKDVLKKILNDFELNKKENEYILNKKKEKIYLKLPEIKVLEDKIATISIDNLKKTLKNENIDTKEIEDINLKISELLSKNNLSLDVKYNCNLCKDTGYVDNKFCSCLKQKVINSTYSQANLLKLADENFKTFDTSYFSKKPDKKFGTDISPCENILAIKKIAENFILNIDDVKQKNLLFIGNTGLGKTFLINCIVDDLIKKGKTVIYQTAPILMDTLISYKYSYDNKNKEEYNKIFNSDLLVIDDLGTETMTNNKFTELFNIINTRLLNNKKIIISTNLKINEIYNTYDERVASRLIGNFIICKFIGEDIRLIRKKIDYI